MTARAVAALAVLAEYAAPLLRRDGVLVAWKGARDAEEEARGAAAAAALGHGGRGGAARSSRSRAPATATCTCSARSRPRRERFPRRAGDGAQAAAGVGRRTLREPERPFAAERARPASDRPGP